MFAPSVSLLPLLLAGSLAQDLPPLPAGLAQEKTDTQTEDTSQEDTQKPALPSLPPGLGSSQKDDPDPQEPALPSLPTGLGSSPSSDDDEATQTAAPAENWFTDLFTGFIEARAGLRLQDDPTQKDASIGEVRAQLQTEQAAGPAVFNLTADIVLDPVVDDYAIDLEEGRGLIDLREANVVLRPTDFLDLKIGRQIATWGTGDLVFINDMFPKDWNSFFIGRDDEYLKAPSDAIRASIFTGGINLEVVYTPRFDSDRYIDGTRISYYNPLYGEIVGRDAILDPITPDGWFDDDEVALRASRNVGAYEIAAYAYDGYWKGPQGATPQGRFTFPELSVYGASIRGPFLDGIANAEFGYYDSREDDSGSAPLLPNSQTRYLVGYEREVMPNLTLGLQYYAEHTEDYDALLAGLAPGAREPEETRHMITTRITKLAYNQNLTLSLFNFWSPNEEDGYTRAKASYKVTDDWLVEGGLNVFYGDEPTFFGQFQDNTNLYVGLRRSF